MSSTETCTRALMGGSPAAVPPGALARGSGTQDAGDQGLHAEEPGGRARQPEGCEGRRVQRGGRHPLLHRVALPRRPGPEGSGRGPEREQERQAVGEGAAYPRGHARHRRLQAATLREGVQRHGARGHQQPLREQAGGGQGDDPVEEAAHEDLLELRAAQSPVVVVVGLCEHCLHLLRLRRLEGDPHEPVDPAVENDDCKVKLCGIKPARLVVVDLEKDVVAEQLHAPVELVREQARRGQQAPKPPRRLWAVKLEFGVEGGQLPGPLRGLAHHNGRGKPDEDAECQD
eukprot:CAMPEP_0175670198 /NCGR_PEP_ID=MMETSP0097-20121207/19535_2 /TAXON_ID=311494 /ORGANISM="Alexandrium monilatum, Strain CCMP3105" /LENGTH=286 /DNA_ID=CAMNT_0016976763 /DNA_START=187 /DNA_END=1048 /DNA_ORIENTATION=-